MCLAFALLLAAVAFAQPDPGRELFRGSCAACHGANGGGGHGPSLIRGQAINRATDAHLGQVIRQGVRATEMPGFQFNDTQVRQLISFLRGLNRPAVRSNVPGDSAAGRELFFGSAGCSNCHMAGGRGGFLGPDLSDIGATRTVEQIQQDLIDPNARIERGFAAITVTTRDGRTIRGVARNQNNYSFQIVDAQGQLHLFLKSDLTRIDSSPQSLMPSDYEQRLTPTQRQDLLAFLARQSVRGKE